jgi:hypothetical protein
MAVERLSAGWEWVMVDDENEEVEDMLDVGMDGIRLRRVWEVELGCGGLQMESGEAGSGSSQPLLGYVYSLETDSIIEPRNAHALWTCTRDVMLSIRIC